MLSPDKAFRARSHRLHIFVPQNRRYRCAFACARRIHSKREDNRSNQMKPITTLLDRDTTLAPVVLPGELAILYGGDLRFPERADRTYVIGNFVSTLDGVVSGRATVDIAGSG